MLYRTISVLPRGRHYTKWDCSEAKGQLTAVRRNKRLAASVKTIEFDIDYTAKLATVETEVRLQRSRQTANLTIATGVPFAEPDRDTVWAGLHLIPFISVTTLFLYSDEMSVLRLRQNSGEAWQTVRTNHAYSLSFLPQIVSLKLFGGCRETWSFLPDMLSSMRSLEALDLGSDESVVMMSEIVQPHTIKRLHISHHKARVPFGVVSSVELAGGFLLRQLSAVLEELVLEEAVHGSIQEHTLLPASLPRLRKFSLRYIKPGRQDYWTHFFPAMPVLQELDLHLDNLQCTTLTFNGLQFSQTFLNSLTQDRPSSLRKITISFQGPFLAQLVEPLFPTSLAARPFHLCAAFDLYRYDPTLASKPGFALPDIQQQLSFFKQQYGEVLEYIEKSGLPISASIRLRKSEAWQSGEGRPHEKVERYEIEGRRDRISLYLDDREVEQGSIDQEAENERGCTLLRAFCIANREGLY